MLLIFSEKNMNEESYIENFNVKFKKAKPREEEK
jgi:hypothetical protein